MQASQLDFIPILMQIALAAGFVSMTIWVSSKLGPKKYSKIKDSTWECGLESLGSARIPFNVKYFLVAILFVLFDVEVIFLYPWAVNFQEFGWDGLMKMGIFLFLIIIGLLYEFKKKGLEWD
ncbi:NADH-quinone oxidoreductase subunit A [Myroides odoratimimus CCUG 12700]|uniref:NADH-quinone oxidoreductase subunit A n=1 Tax=Myroides odoratimimus TaxID=76832 RepID=UPI000353ECA6|nr:NADH-quinone oxidoreductase subunit A [Myroides odoratimimus]EPH10590.1 NADH-quinone oxidoreductase subunit A [Myroides odoratimimus CCUG 12700]